MSTHHTPGPWRVSGFEERCGTLSRSVLGSDGHEVAWLGARTEDEHKKDAQLIASAPELLEAAKKVWDNRAQIFDGTDVDPYWPIGQSLLQLRDAIKKAEGLA